MYELGNSILMCGDSTSADDVSKLMGDIMADITFTSPPYNAGCTPTETKMNKTSKYEGENADNKSETEYARFLNDYLSLSLEYSQFSFMNIQSLSNNKIAIIDTLYENKGRFADVLIWDKLNGQPAMANNVLNSVFEFIYVFSKKGNRAIGTKNFRGTIDNILHISKQNKNEFAKEHNATFPVEFAEFFVKNFSEKMVYEPFGGSGTTLIACEKNNRACRCMELSERYCDVIRRRYTKWAKENGYPLTTGCLE
jgi:DNA modification methylase